MSLDPGALRAAVSAHGPLVRVVIAAHEGSSPREPGAAMLVWPSGQSGTIGGGALEWQAAERARGLLDAGGEAQTERAALGPALGQCCGGAVTLVFERFDAARLEELAPGAEALLTRPVEPRAPREVPLAVQRMRARARSGAEPPAARLVQGWLVEPVVAPTRPLWVWGAGHVGRALVAMAAPLPDFDITWLDFARARFPAEIPDPATPLWAENPAALVRHAPREGEHLIMTHSHALDLELCHALLEHGFAYAGLIGSRSKWARFRARLRSLGHADASISRITCPIGTPELGKHPQAIAVGTIAGLLRQERTRTATKGQTG